MKSKFLRKLKDWIIAQAHGKKKHAVLNFLSSVILFLCTILTNKRKDFILTHRLTEKITYNPNFVLGAIYTHSLGGALIVVPTLGLQNHQLQENLTKSFLLILILYCLSYRRCIWWTLPWVYRTISCRRI